MQHAPQPARQRNGSSDSSAVFMWSLYYA
jgi:hypothetical protein